MSIRFIPLLAVGLTAAAVQDSVHFVPADRVTVRKMSDVPAVDVAAGVHVRTVVGTTGSFSVGDFDPGSASTLHHHTREQANISISGEFDMTLGEKVEKLGPGFGVIVPPNVPHALANKSGERMTVIEFHTVRRPDLIPPRPKIAFPRSDAPAGVAPGRQLIHRMDGPIRESPFSAMWLRGETCLLAWRRLHAGTARVELRAGRVERFVYLVRGGLQLTSPSGVEQIDAGTLVVVPAGTAITIQAAGPEMAAVAEFMPSRSEK